MNSGVLEDLRRPMRNIEEIHSKNKKFFNMFLLGLLMVVAVADFIGIDYAFNLDKNKISPEDGLAYTYELKKPRWMSYSLLNIQVSDKRLVLKENGTILLKGNADSFTIRQSGGGRFSLSGKTLYFSASDNSDPRTSSYTYQAIVPVSLRSWFYVFTLLAAFPVILPLLSHASRSQKQAEAAKTLDLTTPAAPWPRSPVRLKRLFRNMDGRIRVVLRSLRNIPDPVHRRAAGLALVFFGLPLALASLGALFYLAVTVWASGQGYASVSAAVFRLFPILDGLAYSFFPAMFHWLSLYAILMALWMWLGARPGSRFKASGPLVVLFTGSWLRFWGLPCLAACFLLALGVQLHGVPVGLGSSAPFTTLSGMLPYSDPIGYISDARILESGGLWTAMSTQRPLAGGLRNFLLALGGSFQNFQIIQALSAAFCLWVAAGAVGRWRGTPAALLLCALCGLFELSFLATPMTEVNGLNAALLTLPLFILVLRTGSATMAACAAAGTLLALMLRMGAFFTVPALFIWMILFFQKRRRALLAALGLSLLLMAPVVAGNFVLVRLYGAPGVTPGGNFSYGICAMSLGGEYYGASSAHYAAEIASMTDAAAVHRFLYVKAFENIRADPAVFFKSMTWRGGQFRTGVWKHTVGGFAAFPLPAELLFPGLLALFLGYAWWLLGRRQPGEISFYCAIALGLSFSAMFIITDAGWRAIATSYPLLWLFLATGLSAPSRSWAVPPAKFAAWPALLGLGFIFFGALFGPFAGRSLAPEAAPRPLTPGFVGDLGLCGGLTVMPDDARLPDDVPALRESAFLRQIGDKGGYFGADWAWAAAMRREGLYPPYTVYACFQEWSGGPAPEKTFRFGIAEGMAAPPGTGRIFLHSIPSWYSGSSYMYFSRLLEEKPAAP